MTDKKIREEMDAVYKRCRKEKKTVGEYVDELKKLPQEVQLNLLPPPPPKPPKPE